MEITSLDLSLLEEDFKYLEDGHVQKVYQRKDELTVEVYVGGDGKKRLIIGPSYAFLSKYKRDNPTRPPGFCMELRKHLGRVDSIKQRGFDRILEIKSGDTKLIAEMFGRGNFILVQDGKIIGALRQEEWADRTIEVGEEYVYPDPAKDPRDIEDYIEYLEEGELVRMIASELSLGGTYAEEICSRAEIQKDRKIEDLEDDEKERLNVEIENILTQDLSPRIYKDDKLVRPTPFELETYSSYDEEEFEEFSEALDEFFYRREKNREERKKQKAYQEKREGIERQKEQQERKIEGLKKSAEENREKAELIYTEYDTLRKVQKMVEQAIEEHGWKETQEKLDEAETEAARMVKGMNEREEFFTVEVDGMNIKLEPGEDLEARASKYYDKAKNSESKIENAKKALEETEKQLEELEKKEIELEEVMEDKSEKREKEWFEKYRWFYSSEGYLVLCGRDTQTNEMLVKKHMEKNDLYFHADFDGAPSVVVKDGQECGEKTREEAAKAAVTFTKTWKAGIGADDIYYVKPDQVTKEAESGEYVPKGGFIVRGDRTYMRNVSVEAAVGPYEIEEDVWVPMCGPTEAVENHCKSCLELRPGHKKKSKIAKEINREFKEYDLDLDYIIRSLPPGKSEIE